MKQPLEVLPSEYHSKLTLNRSNIFAKDSYLSKSALWEFFQGSPFKWQNCPREYKPTEAMNWGSLVDCLTTSPEDFDATFVIKAFTKYTTAEARTWRDAQLAKGKIIITEEQLEEAKKAAKVLQEVHPESSEIFRKSNTQVVLLSRVMNVNFKGLVDLAPKGERYLADLKTTGRFSMGEFEKTTANLGYHVQAGLYLMLWNICFPEDQRDRFRIIWQESSPPYEVAVTELTALDIADGQDLAQFLINRIIGCAKNKHWPMKFEQCVMQSRAAYAGMQEAQEIDGYTTAPTGKEAA